MAVKKTFPKGLGWLVLVVVLCIGAGVNDILRFARPDGVLYIGAAVTNNGTLGTAGAITSGGSVTVLAGNVSSSAGGNVGWTARGNLSSPSATEIRVNNSGGAVAASLISSNLVLTNGIGPASVDISANSATNMNALVGRVRLNSPTTNNYWVTNVFVRTNSIVVAAMNTLPGGTWAVHAVCTNNGVLRLTTGDGNGPDNVVDVSFFIVNANP